ncbi:MAG: dTDP-4-dehydrorhamnose reductase [Candidatus Hydrogenedentota bacterium]|nr:MAG: dTDP-4-dehydrorhamnose reductase [Candidatus Hydrogenedentota bacterium]PCJ61397.1 MAG: dTDP-4-dehydrorhamnose reductase [Candidatus Hydrogenedentota bacterium]
MKVIIFGAKGQLGRDLQLVFQDEWDVTALNLPELDITDEAAVQEAVAQAKPNVVINAAAYTDVEAAEDDEASAERVNVDAARFVAKAAYGIEVPVVYISTDFVFDGKQSTPYKPDDAPSPLSVYGKTKLDGEIATRETNPHHFILRTAWLYGPGGNNFVEKMLALAEGRSELKVVHDEVGSPTHTWDLAEAVKGFCETKNFGTYHVVNSGQCSRDEFARAIFEHANLDITVHPCTSSEFPMKAERPAYAVLNTDTTETVLGYRMRPWQDALQYYLKRRTS